jgi:hypothetical protein
MSAVRDLRHRSGCAGRSRVMFLGVTAVILVQIMLVDPSREAAWRQTAWVYEFWRARVFQDCDEHVRVPGINATPRSVSWRGRHCARGYATLEPRLPVKVQHAFHSLSPGRRVYVLVVFVDGGLLIAPRCSLALVLDKSSNFIELAKCRARDVYCHILALGSGRQVPDFV